MTICHTLCAMYGDLLIAATYVVQALGVFGIVLGFAMLVSLGGRS